MAEKPKVGIHGLTGCSGDQLMILNCEDELLDIISAIDLRFFPTATSKNDEECELDIALVEGTVITQEDRETLHKLRQRSKILIALGTCAVWGGIPAAKNEVPRDDLKAKVYGAKSYYFSPLVPQPLSSYVNVDFAIPGCPIEKNEILLAIASLLHGDVPVLPDYAVCTECKINESPCILQEKGVICLGPVTVAGCNARCPGQNMPCIGCRGPVAEANVAAEEKMLREKDFQYDDIWNKLKTFAATAKQLEVGA
jgi:coenzyme F420-reducing hydrogenase gamma subunit